MTEYKAARRDDLLRQFLSPGGYSRLTYSKGDDNLTIDEDLIFLESEKFITLVKTLIRIYSAQITAEGISFIENGGFIGLKAKAISESLQLAAPMMPPSKAASNEIIAGQQYKLSIMVLLLVITMTVVAGFILKYEG